MMSSTSSVQPSTQHIRRTSAGIAQFNTISAEGGILPFVSSLIYNERNGQIYLPPSPLGSPLTSSFPSGVNKPRSLWNEKESRYSSTSKPDCGTGTTGFNRIHRNYFTALLFCCTIFSLYSFNSHFSSATALITNASTTTLLERLSFGSIAEPCDPYRGEGHLIGDEANPDRNEWIPNSHCPTKRFLRELRADTLHAKVDLSWLKGKMALLIGDAISRERLQGLCDLLGSEVEVVGPNHRYAQGSKQLRRKKVGKDSNWPRICYVKKYDFLIASVFHFGLDQSDYWRNSGIAQYSSPGVLEQRITDIITPLVVNLRKHGRTSAPDFIEVATGTWDLAKFAKEDDLAERSTVEALTPERLAWYTSRVSQLLTAVEDAFPDAKVKTWRAMYYPIDQRAEQDYFMDKISPKTRSGSTDSTSSPWFAHNRIHQLDQAVRSLILPSTSLGKPNIAVPAPYADWRVNEFGTVLRGRAVHQSDRLHGNALTANVIWADIFLYELWRGTASR